MLSSGLDVVFLVDRLEHLTYFIFDTMRRRRVSRGEDGMQISGGAEILLYFICLRSLR